MKKLFLSLICAAACIAAAAQNSEIATHWSIRAGYDLSVPGKYHSGSMSDDMFRNGNGFVVGFAYYQQIYKGIYFEPSFLINYSTYRTKNLVIMVDENNTISDPGIKKLNLTIPAYFGYRFALSDTNGIRLFTGPVLQYTAGGWLGIDDVEGVDIEKNLFSQNSLFPQQRLNGLWGVGIGYDNAHFYVQVSGLLGITNVLNQGVDGPSYREHHVAATLGYYF